MLHIVSCTRKGRVSHRSRLPHLFVFATTSTLILTNALGAYIGPNDLCPLPTPYPPPGAPWGVVNNPSFEGGFTGGVANQWVGWKHPSYTGTVHYAGTEYKTDGSYSQKLDLPQPISDGQEAGIYQQIYVVAGGTYTVSVRIYLQFAAETYAGEDLIAWLGVDAYGQASANGAGMTWAQDAATKNVWHTRTVTVKAELPVITVSLKGTRKFPQHGNGARVWFDQVTISGPIPTTPPPGPEPDPVDPETLIPATTGANLVTNPSFEQGFANGVATGWNKWSTVGADPYRIWKQSLRVGKVGGGRYDCGSVDALWQMYPKTILLYGGDPELGHNGVYGDINYLNGQAIMDDTIVIGRPAIDNHMGKYLTDPVYWGRFLADRLYLEQQEFPRIDCWQGLNEPDWGETFPKVLAFEKAFAERLHERGMKSCSLNLSTGSPGNIWKMIASAVPGYPSCPDLLAVADYLGHHCYGGPSDDLMIVNQVKDDVCSFAMRPRRFRDMYARRGLRFPPVIATEGSTWGGNTDYWGDTVMSNDLTAMGNYMNVNKWWCGYTNFVVGASCSWGGFEIADHPAIIAAVGAWNANHPADAVDGLYSQVFGSGATHPKTVSELTARGQFDGGVNQVVSGLTPGHSYLLICWMKWEYRGHQPSMTFHLGLDSTGQTTNGAAGTIDWGDDQVADKASIHEIFTHVWRTFTAGGPTASIWLRARQTVADPSFRVFVDQVEVRLLAEQSPSTPLIALDPTSLTPATQQGSDAAEETFTVRNAGTDTLHYTIAVDAPWLSVWPTSGTSSGEADTITVRYETASLAPGTHAATITVTDTAAANNPQGIAVSLNVSALPPVWADGDGDGDVDLTDFSLFQLCFAGPNRPPASNCVVDVDFDNDQDVDLMDFGAFQACFNGPNRPPACR